MAEEHANYTITFLYDGDSLIGFTYGGNNYYYGMDNLGVIHYIYNESGAVVVTYTYDAWGNTIAATGNATLIDVNPIRYKSYYYDSETGLFYLQSRYYDAVVGRFVSADDTDYLGTADSLLSYNLYGYCANNPVCCNDPDGHFVITLACGVVISLKTAVALIALTVFAWAYLTDKNFRNGINTLFDMLIRGAIDGINYVVNTIKEAITDAKKGKKYKGNDDHHIVAKADYRAEKSREILKRYNIGINSSYNLITISSTLHKHIHTSAYHAAVYGFLWQCESKYKTQNDKKNGVISGLIFIGAILRTASKAV